MSSTLAPIPAGLFNYDANDRFTAGDTGVHPERSRRNNNGNTVSSGGVANVYDFENHLIQQGGVSFKYDGDGNRLFKTVAGVTTGYLLDDHSPTGYVQVLDEVQGPLLPRCYVYGLELIEQDRIDSSTLRQSTSYNVYDGHGSVRALTDTTGAVTDTYDYDAFGNLIHSTGSTPNNYLFAGEQFDPDLRLYYNRARYLNVSTGRFLTMDLYEGRTQDPQSLHKYLYAGNDSVNASDPTGKLGLEDVSAAVATIGTLASSMYIQATTVLTTVYLNLWRLPIIVDQVTQYVTVASGAISIIHSASQALPELTRNILASDQEYSPGPSPRGFQVENAAGANLSATNPDFDDFRYGELTQIKSTTQVLTKEALLGVIRNAAQKLGATQGPYVLNTRDGRIITVPQDQVASKNLLFVIPDEALNFTQTSLLPAIQEIEESEGIQIAVQAVKGLRGQP